MGLTRILHSWSHRSETAGTPRHDDAKELRETRGEEIVLCWQYRIAVVMKILANAIPLGREIEKSFSLRQVPASRPDPSQDHVG
jgi:hypothetical protein